LIELINTKKKYGLVWEDKPEDAEELLRTQLPLLREVVEKRIAASPDPCKGGEKEASQRKNPSVQNLQTSLFESETLDQCDSFSSPHGGGWVGAPNHILIEGDNLHALTALTFTHEGKIDVIYIDPPYNTGNKDFKYNDSFVDKEDSFRHSKWLSFMAKRLRIAKQLLSDKGVIFISIDDNEQAQLKMICDKILREDCFIGIFPWKKRTTKSDVPNGISQDFEYIICYANPNFHAGITHQRKYFYTDDYPNDGWRLSDLTKQTSAEERPNSAFDLINPKNGKVYKYNKHRSWAITKDTFEEHYVRGKVVFPEDYDFLKITIPAYRVFESEDKAKALKKFGTEELSKSISTLLPKEVGMNEDGNKEMIEIFGTKKFSFPKPTILVKYLLQISRNIDATILDFFAGSGTTLHATMQLNAEDGGNRQCILVTNNENNICEEVTYERNRRVIQGYTNSKGEWVNGLTNNNLRYYQMEFVASAKTEINRRRLTKLSTDLLQIKEDCYTDITEAEGFDRNRCSIHTNERGKYMVVVYYSRKQIEVTEQLCGWIALRTDTTEKVKIYGFSSEPEVLADDFFEVADRISAVPLPDAIYNAYRATFHTLKLDKKKLEA
jgi:adenine-specific DNA-methyltransferase